MKYLIILILVSSCSSSDWNPNFTIAKQLLKTINKPSN